MIQYTVAMSIRTLCILVCLVVPGWWRLLPAIGAIVLPYIAVVLANASIVKPTVAVLRPGSIVRRSPDLPSSRPRSSPRPQ